MVDRHHPGKAPMAVLQALSDGACQTVSDLESKLDLTRRQISNAAMCLLRRDYLIWLGAGRYQISEAGKTAAIAGEVITSGPMGPNRFGPRVVRNTIRERAWRAMRIRKRFTVPDLVTDAATEADGEPANNLRRYLRALERAGYVANTPRRIAGTAMTSNGHLLWILVKDTGPLAPIVLTKLAAIRDQNTREDVPCSRA